jgi:succinoglycan biosynthesis protein ExoM
MTASPKHISVCICAFRRPRHLGWLLDHLERQRTDERFSFSIVVTDNDHEKSSQAVVAKFAATSRIAVTYSCEGRQNISLARNEALRHANGDFVAFIDDDEFPDADWLLEMLDALERYQAAGVLGPTQPCYEKPPPRWIVDGRFWERPDRKTGAILKWKDCRTANVLFRREILDDLHEVFDPVFGSGGEDQDFFRRMMLLGHVFRWCNEGFVHETIPTERCTRTYLLKRAMLRGRNSINQPPGRASLAFQSVLAVPAYLSILPFTLILGQHVFMKYSVKLCDHTGRILALLRLNPIRQWT